MNIMQMFLLAGIFVFGVNNMTYAACMPNGYGCNGRQQAIQQNMQNFQNQVDNARQQIDNNAQTLRQLNQQYNNSDDDQ